MKIKEAFFANVRRVRPNCDQYDEIAGGVLLQQLTGIPRRYASHGQTLPSRSTKGSLLRCLSVRTAVLTTLRLL